jgi:drug/metabolite transporter (DMT)-like permease
MNSERIDRTVIQGHLAAIATNVIFGLNITITKSLLSGWMTPMGYTFTRMVFGLLMFWTISFFMNKEKVNRRDLLVIIAGGLLGLVITQVAFAAGLTLVTPVTWSLITSLNPIVVLLLSAFFLKETFSLKKLLGVIIGISGAAIIILQNRNGGSVSNSLWGILTALGAVISHAAYIVLMRKTASKYAPATVMKWMFLFAVVALMPFGIGELPEQRLYSPEITLVPVLKLGFALVFSSTIAFFLMPVALKRIKATTASIYINLQPIVASAVAIAVGQDIFSWDKPLALILVITGVYLVTQETKGISGG